MGTGFISFRSRYGTRFVGRPDLVSGIKFVGQSEYFIFSYDIVVYVLHEKERFLANFPSAFSSVFHYSIQKSNAPCRCKTRFFKGRKLSS